MHRGLIAALVVGGAGLIAFFLLRGSAKAATKPGDSGMTSYDPNQSWSSIGQGETPSGAYLDCYDSSGKVIPGCVTKGYRGSSYGFSLPGIKPPPPPPPGASSPGVGPSSRDYQYPSTVAPGIEERLNIGAGHF